MSFSKKVVLITGGSSGIGAATAILFAREGADVAIVGRNESKLQNVAEQCQNIGKKPLVIKADMSKDDEAATIIKQTVDAYGKLDVLVNNAGILRAKGILEGKFLETYDEIMNTNMRAVINLTTLAAPYLIETKGNIVNVSSIAGSNVCNPKFIAYRVSKAALDHFTRGAALELATAGVRVNGVCPGPVKTDIFNAADQPGIEEHLKTGTALNRISESEEIADLILYLASDKAKSITGSNYVIDNGFLLKGVAGGQDGEK